MTISPESPLADYKGKNLKDARKELESQGHKVTAKSADGKEIILEANWTVTSQEPAAAVPGSDVTLIASKPATTKPAEATEPAKSESEKILTVENNADLAALLAAKDDFKMYKEFVTKYQARTIEFDGNIAFMGPHGTNKTRFDILIYGGNYAATPMTGPSFQFNDVNIVSDLHLTGSNIPDTLGAGRNLHIVAKVESYSKGDLILLDPISTQVR